MKLRGIVIRDLRMVYWYLPKTSCTAMKWYFAQHLKLNVPRINGTDQDIHGQDIGFEFTEEVIDGFYNWAFVRNPYDRISSLYSQKIVSHVDRKVFPDETLFYQGMPFAEFLEQILKQKPQERHYMPQSELLGNKTITTHHMENSLALKLITPKNQSAKLSVWNNALKEQAYEFYKEDFVRFGYER